MEDARGVGHSFVSPAHGEGRDRRVNQVRECLSPQPRGVMAVAVAAVEGGLPLRWPSGSGSYVNDSVLHLNVHADLL